MGSYKTIHSRIPEWQVGTVVPPLLWAFDVLGMRQTEVARLVDVGAPTLNQWRSGRRPIPRMRAIVLAAHLQRIRSSIETMDQRGVIAQTVIVAIDGVLNLLDEDTRSFALWLADQLPAVGQGILSTNIHA